MERPQTSKVASGVACRSFLPFKFKKDIGANTLYATRQYAAADKARDEFSCAAINWIAGAPPRATDGLRVKVRHGAAMHEGTVTLQADGTSAHVRLAERNQGLAPGQFAAFYDGEVCLGSGVIVAGAT